MCFVKFTGYKGEWSWLGSTLNPYYEGNSPSEMIDDDRFVRGSYGNWEFGINDDGDLMSWLNLQQILKRTTEMGPIHLVCIGVIYFFAFITYIIKICTSYL